MRYELEYELQSRRDKEQKLATKTDQVLIDWQIDGDQAEAEKEADRPTFLNGSSTHQTHRRHHPLRPEEDGSQAQQLPASRQGRKQRSSIE